jgi:PAS domain S-box-containing protein
VESATRNNQEFEALFNNAAIGIIIVDEAGEIVLANNFALKQFGYNSGELLHKKIEVLIPQRYSGRHEHHRANYYGAGAHSRPMGTGMDLYAIKKNGEEFPVEVSLSSYNTKENKYAIAFISDITIRKRSEEALINLNAELEEKVRERTQSLSETVKQLNQRIKEAEEKDNQLRAALEKEKELNELKSKFVSLASHEFRTPLSTVLSSAYLVSKYETAEDHPKREKHLQRIVSSVNMLTDILNDFLSVGKIEEGRIQVRLSEFNVKDLVKGLINELQTIQKKGQKISYVHTGKEMVMLDPSLLKHIVMNLLSNAIKFSPEKSEISISTKHAGNELVLSVADKGMGISKEDQEHLFERFFRGHNVTNIQGTGLGLHIVGKYAELLNGHVSCNSEINQGTEFIITFNLNAA